ncbi:B-cell receptor CD22-like [Paramuricea clavata]|uniref:B-cell receptor CD22-like n=1 Tax=Paramuricea clavata TaxID=317549 RepID=A0A6S7H1X5_PARCT|nr:B-cell receptor CD22-like [Paramuricea clavata]
MKVMTSHACECQGLNDNPPANVTWNKDGKQIGKTRTEKKILTLIKVDEIDSATYKCMAESYPNAIMYRDEKSIRVDVKFKPKDTSIEFTQNPAIFGRSVTIMCKSRGSVPEALSYAIFHNDTQLINEKMYTTIVAWSDAGTYKCFGEDEHGNYSASGFLNVKGEATGSKVDCDSCGTVVVWHIVVTLVSGFILGILFSYIVWCSHRRWLRNRKPERSPEPKITEAVTTYQELDLTKMNKEDNYQSLRVNAASHDAGNQAGNDNDSTYTELSITIDMENKYQSLT